MWGRPQGWFPEHFSVPARLRRHLLHLLDLLVAAAAASATAAADASGVAEAAATAVAGTEATAAVEAANATGAVEAAAAVAETGRNLTLPLTLTVRMTTKMRLARPSIHMLAGFGRAACCHAIAAHMEECLHRLSTRSPTSSCPRSFRLQASARILTSRKTHIVTCCCR